MVGMEDISDRDVVIRTRRGKTECYGEMVKRYQTSVFNVCYRMLGERREAEDLTQEAFIRAFERLHTYDQERPFGPWIRRIATNLCYNHLKRNIKSVFSLHEEIESKMHLRQRDPENKQIQRERSENIRTVILELPPHYRAVIELRHFQVLSYTEIAEVLNLPLSDVKSHLFRARKRLGAKLKAYKNEESHTSR